MMPFPRHYQGSIEFNKWPIVEMYFLTHLCPGEFFIETVTYSVLHRLGIVRVNQNFSTPIVFRSSMTRSMQV